MTPLDQIHLIFRNLKWIIAISILVSGILLLPNQVIELYRISAAERGLVAAAQFVSIGLLAVAIWLAALQINVESLALVAEPTRKSTLIARHLPALLGSLPLFAAALAQFSSRPLLQNVPDKLVEVGSVFRVQFFNLQDVNTTLVLHGLVFLAMGLLLAAAMMIIHDRMLAFSAKANGSYFSRNPFRAATAAVVAGVAAAFIWEPVSLPRALGPFGILALFGFCLTAIVIHLSLITIRRRIPYIPILLLVVLAFSYFDLNDNHLIRTLPAKASGTATAEPARMSAKDAFAAWLRQRGTPGATTNRYPVFIVTAQGGGIYAAYNAAVFLARMQDLCPTFHHHVFAISGVSGGSVGAAAFAAALDAAKEEGPQPNASVSDPCPRITQFLSSAHAFDDLDRVGETEGNIDLTLKSDYLSPLLASTLFPNFTQSIIPYPLGFLDRARALEYALEQSAEDMYARKKPAPIAGPGTGAPPAVEEHNLLKKPFQTHWSPTGPIPALLLNATDSGTGKRVVISPFDLERADAVSSDVCILPSPKSSAQFSLSSAAFISARFPWVTPAATADLSNTCIMSRTIDSKSDKAAAEKVRLVDGGYIDNSGIDTALDLVSEIQQVTPGPDHGNAAAAMSAQLPPFKIYLVSLSSGDFPNRREYSLNELLEPIRALLNGREARASIAHNRARNEFRAVAGGIKELPRFNRTGLQSYYYDLPLGWAMSVKTREIIALDSGRFWDCEPDKDFAQSDKSLSNADCVQLQIYHLLNNSSEAALVGLEDSIKTVKEIEDLTARSGQAPRRLEHKTVLACYEKDWQKRKRQEWQDRQAEYKRLHEEWKRRPPAEAAKPEPALPPPFKQSYLSHYQAEHVKELLREWDRRTDLDDLGMLAYVLGSVSYDSDDFRRTSENLTYKTPAQMLRSAWKGRIAQVNRTRRNEIPPKEEVDLTALTNNPKDFAEMVWGWKNNWFGNNVAANGTWDESMKDGWKYRSRGIYQLVGREQYRDESDWLGRAYPAFAGMLPIDRPDVVLNRTMSAKIAFSHFSNWKSPPIVTATDERTRLRKENGLERKTLSEVLTAHGGDFRMARLNQIDMGEMSDIGVAVDQAKMFLGCIKQAPIKAP